MMGGFGGIGMLLWAGVIVAVVWWIAQAAGARTGPSALPGQTSGTPRETLDARLARGDITVEEYRELRKVLE